MTKRMTAMIVALMMIFSLFIAINPANVQAEVAKQDWKPYDELIAKIKSETDFVAREALMHEAEDMLMGTYALCPLYYYNDSYMAKEALKDFWTTLYGYKYFMFASNGDKTTLRLNISSEPDRLDPALNSSVDGAILAVHGFSGLFKYGQDGSMPEPDLVETYEVSEDGLEYTFKLLPDLKWSDGSPLTAEDFVYSWKRAANPLTASDYAYMFDVIEGYPEVGENAEDLTEEEANALADGLNVVAEDELTLKVKLKAPCAYFLDLCAFATYLPVNKEAVENAEGFRDEDGKIIEPGAWALEAGFISNGAYVLKEWTHNESMVYEKNPNYHRADEVKIERLEFMLSDDDAAIFAAYRSGDLDFIDSVPTDEIPALLDKDPEFYVVDHLGTYYVTFNVNSPMFDGKTVEEAAMMRKALALLIDREYIVDTVTQTGQEIANTFIPAGMADGHGGTFKSNDEDYTYPDEENVGYYQLEPNVEEAIELLKQAGFEFEGEMLSAETPLHIKYLTNKSEAHAKIAELIQQDFAVIGISMDVSQMDWSTFLDERKAGHFDVARNGWIADFNDPINMLEMWTTVSGNNDAQFGK